MLATADPVMLDQGPRDHYTGMELGDYNPYESSSMLPSLQYSYSDASSLLGEAHTEVMTNTFLGTSAFNIAEHPSATLSSTSAQSIPSATSSTVGSPYSGPAHAIHAQDAWPTSHQGLGIDPTIVSGEHYGYELASGDFESDMGLSLNLRNKATSVDPSLIQSPYTSSMQMASLFTSEPLYSSMPSAFNSFSPVPSPPPQPQALSASTYPSGPFGSHHSPIQADFNSTFEPTAFARPPSVTSQHSFRSHQSPSSASFETDEEGRQRGRCPHPDCGKIFKDLKAHMLTHQSERPEKCPILTCEYNQKGFARKYDKNRHTLTHYKGTMVCGFCPGSGSATEKSFNRADVFKRHLTSVHGVEQSPPNSRKRSPASNKKLSSYCQDATGKCSTCSETFHNAQDFYEHLDECVLRVVQQEEPSEAINQQHLTTISADDAVKETFDRHRLNQSDTLQILNEDDADDDEDDEDDEEDEDLTGRSARLQNKTQRAAVPNSRVVLGTNSAITKNKGTRKGLTFSKGGVPLAGKGRKKRKHYPPSWGMSPDKMKMKKRVLCVYDGERRLWKDDMMLDNEFEVRMKLADGKSYVTDLDVETLKRAQALHDATEEERGPWIPEDGPVVDFNGLLP